MSAPVADPAVWLVISNLPDEATAQAVARELIERRVAACVNVMAPCWSVYRWQGAVDAATEVPLVAKVAAAGYPALEAALRALHPYEVPEIVAVPVAAGLPAYLAWVAAEGVPGSNGGEKDANIRENDP